MKYLLILLCLSPIISVHSQIVSDSLVYDTIPAHILIYEDSCNHCPIYFEYGYVVYQNIMEKELIVFRLMNGKDSMGILNYYKGDPRLAKKNPYLRSNKLPMWMNHSVWGYKLDYPSKMQPANEPLSISK